jgi:hypothetical protein
MGFCSGIWVRGFKLLLFSIWFFDWFLFILLVRRGGYIGLGGLM